MLQSFISRLAASAIVAIGALILTLGMYHTVRFKPRLQLGHISTIEHHIFATLVSHSYVLSLLEAPLSFLQPPQWGVLSSTVLLCIERVFEFGAGVRDEGTSLMTCGELGSPSVYASYSRTG